MDSGGSSSGGSHNVIPESVMEAVRRTSRNVEDVEANLGEFLSYCDTETLSDLEHLERANVLLMIAKPTPPSLLERLSLYEEKLKQCMDLNKAHLRLSTTIDPQAAARFIEHSLPDLSREQKKSMREVIRVESRRINYLERTIQKKRKYQAPEKQSVRSAAQEFLEKASRELLTMLQNDLYSYNLRIPRTSRKLWIDPLVHTTSRCRFSFVKSMIDCCCK